jgi:hypothetical protein
MPVCEAGDRAFASLGPKESLLGDVIGRVPTLALESCSI